MKLQSIVRTPLLAMATSTVAIVALSQSASAANVFNGSEYFLTTNDTDWQSAQNEATGLANPGNLVSINSQAEQDFLVSVFGGSELYWIGLTDSAVEGTFSWVNGDPFTPTVTYENWAPGEPNNFNVNPNGTGEDFVVMNWLSVPGEWNDVPSPSSFSGPAQHFGIIERPATAVPTPALLPGLLAFGAGIVRKRKAAATA